VGFSSILRFSHVKSFGVFLFLPSLFYAFYYLTYYLFRKDLIWVLLPHLIICYFFEIFPTMSEFVVAFLRLSSILTLFLFTLVACRTRSFSLFFFFFFFFTVVVCDVVACRERDDAENEMKNEIKDPNVRER